MLLKDSERLRFRERFAGLSQSALILPWGYKDGTFTVMKEARRAAATHISIATHGETPPA